MLLLNKVFANTCTLGQVNEMNETEAYHEHLSFPVDVINAQDDIGIDEIKIKFICGRIISDAGYRVGRLGVVVGDNTIIHELNNTYLRHDCPTDVISFCLDRYDDYLEGEVVVSAEVAQERYQEFGWDMESELMLYIVHGTLHQVGYEDHTEQDARLMRQMEAAYLALIGIDVPDIDSCDQ